MTARICGARLATAPDQRYGGFAMMTRRRPSYVASTLALWLVWLCWLSCTTPDVDYVAAPTAHDWHELMEEVIGPGFDDILVHESDRGPEDMDYELIERTANNMANGMAMGHAELEQKDIPEFATMARRTETWLREIVDQASAHEGMAVQQLVAKGEADYCAKCHDAASESR